MNLIEQLLTNAPVHLNRKQPMIDWIESTHEVLYTNKEYYAEFIDIDPILSNRTVSLEKAKIRFLIHLLGVYSSIIAEFNRVDEVVRSIEQAESNMDFQLDEVARVKLTKYLLENRTEEAYQVLKSLKLEQVD